MRKAVFFPVVTLLLTGCATLSKTQIESVNRFATVSQNFSAFPSKIMEGLADVRAERSVFFAGSVTDPKHHMKVLDSINVNRMYAENVGAKANITFRIIDKYAASLTLLSCDRYSQTLEKQSAAFGVNIDTLIGKYNSIDPSRKLPVGIGNAAGKLLLMGGRQYIRNRQAREIKKFVREADTLISVMTSNLIEFLESGNINELIDAEESGLHLNYLSFYRLSGKSSYLTDRDYLALKKRLEDIRVLRTNTVTATKELRKAHSELLVSVQKRRSLKESADAVKQLAEQVKELKSIVESIEK